MTEAAANGGEKERDYAGAKLGMWLFLLTEFSFFFGPFLLYAVFRFRNPADFRSASLSLNLALGALNTVILITSSLTMALSISAEKKSDRGLARLFLVFTIVLGSAFLAVKYLEWSSKIAHGLYPNSRALLSMPAGEVIFYGLYFFMTGLHGLHVVAGIALLLWVLYGHSKGSEGIGVRMENSGLYWHLVDIVWIYLFPFFYLVT